jgi:hypothetical protein
MSCRLIVSNVRDAPPLANENPAVPGPSDESLNDVAAKPDACHARGVGEGDGAGDGAAEAAGGATAGFVLASGAGVDVCATAGAALKAHAAVKAAISVFKPPPNEGAGRMQKPC